MSLKRIATRNIVLVNPDRIHQLCHPSSAQLHQDAAFALYLSAPSPSGSVSDSLHSSLNSKTIPYLFFLRKEVIQPHLPIRLPCYDFTPVTGPTFDSSFQAVSAVKHCRFQLVYDSSCCLSSSLHSTRYARRRFLAG